MGTDMTLVNSVIAVMGFRIDGWVCGGRLSMDGCLLQRAGRTVYLSASNGGSLHDVPRTSRDHQLRGLHAATG